MCCFTYLELVLIFLISAYSFLTSRKIDVVTVLFCRLQGTTMEHNLDVSHMFLIFLNLNQEDNLFKSKYDTTVKQTLLSHASHRHNGLSR